MPTEKALLPLTAHHWLFETFWHWRVLLSRCTEPEHAKLIHSDFWMKWVAGARWKDIRTFTKIYFIYILRKGPAHIVQRSTGKSPGAPDGQSATVMNYYIETDCTWWIWICSVWVYQSTLKVLHTGGLLLLKCKWKLLCDSDSGIC